MDHHIILVIIMVICECVAAEDRIACSDSVCEGIEGDTIVIPCGSDELYPDNVTYTYFNQSSKSILLSNSDDYLMINLTAFMDNSRITCIVEDDPTPLYYSYTLSVMYPPQEIGTLNPLLRLNQEYFLPCPLSSHPQPSCSWRVLNCFNKSIAQNISDYDELTEDGCQLHIKQATVELSSVVCLQCIATNALGSNTFIYNSLQINYCPSSSAIQMSPQPIDPSAPLKIPEGSNLTLKCDGYGFGEFGVVVWCFNSFLPNRTCSFGANTEYDKLQCRKTSLYIIQNISEADSGTYRCYFMDDQFSFVQINVISKDYPSVMPTTSTPLPKITVICISLSVAFLAISLTLIVVLRLVVWKCYNRSTTTTWCTTSNKQSSYMSRSTTTYIKLESMD